MKLGATPGFIGIPARPSTDPGPARYFSTAVEAAGGAWASSLRAALPVYRRNPTVRFRPTPLPFNEPDDVDRWPPMQPDAAA